MQGAKRDASSSHPVRQGRDGDLDALGGHGPALPGERQMHGELVADDHRQQARPGAPARDRVVRRRRLSDGLAGPAVELLPHRLHDLTALDETSRSAASDVRSRLPPVSGPPVPRPTQRARRRSRRRGWGRRTLWAGVNQSSCRHASPVRPPESICRRLSPRCAVARSFSDCASRSRPACRQAAPKRSRPTPPAPTAR